MIKKKVINIKYGVLSERFAMDKILLTSKIKITDESNHKHEILSVKNRSISTPYLMVITWTVVIKISN